MSNTAVPDLLSRAVDRHRAGDAAAAEAFYRQVLAEAPDQPDALHLLGLVLLAKGNADEALELVRKAVALAPANADYHVTLGTAEQALGWLDEAAASYRRALAANPRVEGAHNNLGTVLRELSDNEAAVSAFRQACEITPQAPEVWTNYGMTLKESGRLEDAEAAIRRALAIDPHWADAHSELGSLRMKQNRTDEAIAAYRTAVAINPDDARAHDDLGWALLAKLAPYQPPPTDALVHAKKAVELDGNRWTAWENLGNALSRLDHYGDAVRAFGRSRSILRRPGGGNERHPTFRGTSRAKLTHDIEQIQYLIEHRRIGVEGPELLAAYRSALDRLPAPPPDSHVSEIDAGMRELIGATYNRLWNVADAPEISSGAIGRLDRAAIERDYLGREPGITWVDGLLTQEALASLRRFCLESTVWFDCFYRNNYLGAFAEDGFMCPLLWQIGRELPQRLPGIFGSHTLRKVWAFKYGDEIKGIESHADFAAINVNFWITPDEANSDPASGGLVLWDKEAPAEWDFATFNYDQQAMDDFISASEAITHTVPYRCNRAVIFNSDLIHRTDDIHFHPGYENRRINVTFLYGVREGRM